MSDQRTRLKNKLKELGFPIAAENLHYFAKWIDIDYALTQLRQFEETRQYQLDHEYETLITNLKLIREQR